MTTTSSFDFTRRAFGQMLGAAALTTPSIAKAVTATPRDDTILSLHSVPLAWPQFHRLPSFYVTPEIGESVALKREARYPFDNEAMAVFSQHSERIGYIPRRHNAALSWALDRGDLREARITKIAAPVVRGRRIAGWGAFHIDVHVAASGVA